MKAITLSANSHWVMDSYVLHGFHGIGTAWENGRYGGFI